MQVPDIINGVFEGSGTFFIYLHIRKLHHDKIVKGVHFAPIMFFAAWGLWNLFYYPHLEQWFSFAGGCGIVLANLVWLGQMFYYIRREHELPNYGHVPISITQTQIALRKQIRDFIEDESSGPPPGAFEYWKDKP